METSRSIPRVVGAVQRMELESVNATTRAKIWTSMPSAMRDVEAVRGWAHELHQIALKDGYAFDELDRITATLCRQRPGAVAEARWPPVVTQAEPQRIVLAPGVRFGRLLGVVVTGRAYRRYVYSQIAEMQAEYAEELAAGRVWHARWVSARGHVLLIPGWIYGLVAKAIRWIFPS